MKALEVVLESGETIYDVAGERELLVPVVEIFLEAGGPAQSYSHVTSSWFV